MANYQRIIKILDVKELAKLLVKEEMEDDYYVDDHDYYDDCYDDDFPDD